MFRDQDFLACAFFHQFDSELLNICRTLDRYREEASRQGIGTRLLTTWKREGPPTWRKELLWKATFFNCFPAVTGLPTKACVPLVDAFFQTLIRVNGSSHMDYDETIVGVIGDFETKNSFHAFVRLQRSVETFLPDGDGCSAALLKWDDFLVLRKQLEDATNELYYSVRYDPEEFVPAPEKDEETNEFLRDLRRPNLKYGPRLRAGEWEDEVMAYLYRPYGFLYECHRAHAMSLGMCG